MNRLVAFLVLLVGCFAVSATDYYQQQRLIVPSYGAGFQRGSDAEHLAALRDLLLEIKGLRQDFAGLRQDLVNANQQAGQPKADPVVDGAKVIANRCMVCHDSKTAEGGLILVDKDGLLADLSVEQRYRNQRRVSSGTMPPAKDKQGRALPPLSAAEKTALLAVVGPPKKEDSK